MMPRQETKWERKLQYQLNRVMKLLPGKQRIWELGRFVMELEMAAEDTDDPALRDSLIEDALFLSRLEWDLAEMRDALRGNPRRTVAASRLDPSLYPRGPRP